jgi:2-polyprenyl-3-methyl-5-hydroxy-6-metoxy-1,4-benzoquinol methylase
MLDVIKREADKYVRVWTEIPNYGKFSPAMTYINQVIPFFNDNKIKTVLDAGCGSGKATYELLKANFDVTGIDYTNRGLNRSIRADIDRYVLDVEISDFHPEASLSYTQRLGIKSGGGISYQNTLR